MGNSRLTAAPTRSTLYEAFARSSELAAHAGLVAMACAAFGCAPPTSVEVQAGGELVTGEAGHRVDRDDDVAGFAGLGDLPGGEHASYARDVSDSGDVVVGFSRTQAGDEAVRWTPSEGLVGLGGPDSRANAVSPDGLSSAGSIAQDSYELGRAAVIWRAGQSVEVLPPAQTPQGHPLFYPVDATAIVRSGDVYGTCIQYGAYGDPLLCHISADGELTASGIGRIFAADGDGHLVGTRYPDSRAAALWGSMAFQQGLLSYEIEYPEGSNCVRPHACRSEARAFALDPVIVVGTSQVPPVGQLSSSQAPLLDTAWAATEREGMRRLPDLPGGDEASGAYAIDRAGRLIGGFGTGPAGRQAVIWVDGEPRSLSRVLADAGGHLPEGWVLQAVRAISADGRTLVGDATNAQGNPEAFRVTLPGTL